LTYVGLVSPECLVLKDKRCIRVIKAGLQFISRII
jgi:hypothetical protein